MDKICSFLNQSVSPYHAVKQVKEALKVAGFQSLEEENLWQLEPGKSYYVTRNESSLLAFSMPKEKPLYYHLCASHSDFPTFRIKKAKKKDAFYAKAEIEGYGGMIHTSWFDRPLGLAGRVIKKTKEGIFSVLIAPDKNVFVIPNLSIHFNREINNGFGYNPQTDMAPLMGLDQELSIKKLCAEAADVAEEEILGSDLYVYNRDKGRIMGADDSLIGSPRLDDLQCAYATLRGFLASKPEEFISVYALFDNEEVGSGTKQGADSTFLEEFLEIVLENVYPDKNRLWKRSFYQNSFLLSADNGHAVHPNHPEKTDPTNRPYLNGGVVLKYNGSQKYTTDGYSAAIVRQICNTWEIPLQTFANRSDIAGGSTLGNISTAHVSIPSADVGLAQLAMHSAFETAGVKDTEALAQLAEHLFA